MVRTECLKLVTIGIWSHLAHQGKREQFFTEYPNLQKLWNSSNKKMVAAGKQEKMINYLEITHYYYYYQMSLLENKWNLKELG